MIGSQCDVEGEARAQYVRGTSAVGTDVEVQCQGGDQKRRALRIRAERPLALSKFAQSQESQNSIGSLPYALHFFVARMEISPTPALKEA